MTWLIVASPLLMLVWFAIKVWQVCVAIDRLSQCSPIPIGAWREFALSLHEPERSQMFSLIHEGRFPLGSVIRFGLWRQRRVDMINAVRRNARHAMVRSKPGVYIVRSGKYCKIGMSTNVRSRLYGLQTANPQQLAVVRIFWTSKPAEIEAQLHAKFAHKRLAREWFDLDENDIQSLMHMSTVSLHQ